MPERNAHICAYHLYTVQMLCIVVENGLFDVRLAFWHFQLACNFNVMTCYLWLDLNL